MEVTLSLIEFPHRLYDQLYFYFGWLKTETNLLLSPRLTDRSIDTAETLDIPSVIHLPAPQGDQWVFWRRALILRKYLTLFVLAHTVQGEIPVVPMDQFIREWNATDANKSECW